MGASAISRRYQKFLHFREGAGFVLDTPACNNNLGCNRIDLDAKQPWRRRHPASRVEGAIPRSTRAAPFFVCARLPGNGNAELSRRQDDVTKGRHRSALYRKDRG